MDLVERAKNLIVQPQVEWPVIAAEPHTMHGLYTRYVMILAAIPPTAAFIGFAIVGFPLFRVGIGAALAYAVLLYLLSLAIVYVLAVAIDALARNFGGEKSFEQAFKVAAFAPTAAWLAGVFNLLPALSILSLLGLYSLYLLFTGLGPVMRVPEEKLMPYAVVVIIIAIVLNFVASLIANLTLPAPVRGF
jgi:Yip1-like protein